MANKAKKSGNPPTDYERIFHPQRLAIIGVSAEASGAGFGTGIFKSITAMAFAGEILPVNPKGGSIDGLNIFKSVEEIPGEIDFAIIAVAARFVPDVLDACRKKGAAGAEIISSGFSELGTDEGKELERRIKEIAAKGIRVVGPNCFGIYCPASGLTLLPGPDLSRESGPVAFIAQSGGMSIDFAHAGKWMGVRFSKMVSFGNGADLRETDLLRYFKDDPETRVISMYIEGIQNGDSFFKEIKTTASKKPVIVYKGGLSRAGARTVASHTASMGGSGTIWRSILKQANAVQVHDTEELAQTSLAFALLPPKTFSGISVIGGGGAIGVTACDTAEAYDIEIPPLADDLQARIYDYLPKPGSSAINPVDVANPFVPPQYLKEVLLAAAEDKRIELQIIVSLLYHYKSIAKTFNKTVAEITPYKELARVIREVADKTGKPVIAVLPNAKRGVDDLDIIEMIALTKKEYVDYGIPVFDELHDAIRTVAHVNTYYGGKNHE
ncbi:MAG: CoA-binding protein [Deltaproteobacteria bacterium]|nr:CoA-binding protein [Deltaproteobacteria bacterium]